MAQGNLDVLRRVYGEWAEGRFFTTPEVFDPSVEVVFVETNPDMAPTSGAEDMTRTWMEWLRGWDDVAMEAQRFIETGDHVVAFVTLHGRGKASGVQLQAEQVHVWTFAGGRAVRVAGYVQADEALASVGLRP